MSARVSPARVSLVVIGLAGLVAVPIAVLAAAGVGLGELLSSAVGGLAAAVDAVGWVFVPQFALAVAVLSLTLQQLATRAAGMELPPTPAWLDPAVESALLLAARAGRFDVVSQLAREIEVRRVASEPTIIALPTARQR